MKQVRQDLSVEYGRYLRGEIPLREYAESTARNDVEVEEIVSREIHRVAKETSDTPLRTMRRDMLMRIFALGIGGALIGGVWLFYVRALIPTSVRGAFDVIVCSAVAFAWIMVALACRLLWVIRSRR